MGRIIYCPLIYNGDALQVTNDADQDIWELAAPAGNKLVLHGWEVTSAKTTAEIVRLRLLFGTASGTGGQGAGDIVEVNADNGDDATIVGALEVINTTPGTDGAVLQSFEWEQLGPLGMVYTPEMRPVIDVSTYLKLNLETALAATTEWDGWVCWEEL